MRPRSCPDQRRPGEIPAGISTPAYVYDLDEVQVAHGLLSSALPKPSRLFYSVKANPHPRIVERLWQAGCAMEVSSPGELAVVRRAGVKPTQVLYSGPAKRDEDVVRALDLGVRHFSVDSREGISQLARLTRERGKFADFLLRINAAGMDRGRLGLRMTGAASQFGADAEFVLAQPDEFRGTGPAQFAGFHFFFASNVSEVDGLVEQLRIAAATTAALADAMGCAPAVVDFGGGFGAPFGKRGTLPDISEFEDRAAKVLDSALPDWRSGAPTIFFESGRYLTATCGTLFLTVLDVKTSHDKQIIITDSGINHIGGMSGLRRLPRLQLDVLPFGAEDGMLGGREATALVTGPLCSPLDTLSEMEIGNVEIGDLLWIPNVGAYGLSASLIAFLSHPSPSEVVVKQGRIVDVTRIAYRRERLYGPEEVID